MTVVIFNIGTSVEIVATFLKQYSAVFASSLRFRLDFDLPRMDAKLSDVVGKLGFLCKCKQQ